METVSAVLRRGLILFIEAYRRLLSPLLGPCCRFHPSCSQYAQSAIRQHGAVSGSWLTLKRIIKCMPWHPGGIDPVPTARGSHSQEELNR